MNIKDIDKNFRIQSDNSDGLKYYMIPCEPFDLYGVYYEERTKRFVRMPSDIADKVSANVGILNSNTAGGRIRFSTDSRRISVQVRYNVLSSFPHLSILGGSGFILLEEREHETAFIYSFMPDYFGNEFDNKTDNGYCVAKTINDGKLRNYILYFPNYNDVKELKIGVDDGAFVGHGKKYKDSLPIVYYGSSITQGGCASRADNSYQALISKWTNIDFLNFGFSGSALGEETIAEYISSINCSAFVMDYDYNAPTSDFLGKTHLNFYRKYREKRPLTPIVFVTKPNIDEDMQGGEERFRIIKRTYLTAKREGDLNVYLINGKTLFGKADRENCTVDGTHPNDLGFYRMAKRIYRAVRLLVDNNL